MITESKPGSPEEVLEHAGVKGMKWGVRNRRDLKNTVSNTKNLNKVLVKTRMGTKPSGNTSKTSKPPQKGIALTRSSREFRAQYPTAKLQAKAIREAQAGVRQRTKAIRKEKDSVERARLKRDHMNHPGTAIALRTTRGEKVVNALLLGMVPREGISGDVAAISTAATLGTAAARRGIERKQRRGGYT